jgi:phosphoribosylamine--glycine ligase
MYKACVIGEGGREHAIANKLYEEGVKIFSYMAFKNPGIAKISSKLEIGGLTDFEKIKNFVLENNVDFVIPGPELPIVNGIADYLERYEVPCISPFKNVARIEGSKSFARLLMKKHRINAYPKFILVNSVEEFKTAIKEIDDYVIKPDGLTGGKGVKVLGEHFFNEEEALDYADKVLKAHGKLLVEERMEGEEFVLQCFTDGRRCSPMPLVHDHKRAYDDDKGPNTGGMGSISYYNHLLPFVPSNYYEEALRIMNETILALRKETGISYKGILYGQFMLTKEGSKIVEYNVRFGDPEAMNVLSLMNSNFIDIIYSIIEENLKAASFERLSTVCVYLAPRGYPDNPAKDSKIEVNEERINNENRRLYYASIREENGELFTTGSRSLAILAKEKDIYEAHKSCYDAIKYIKGELFYRKDIGSEYLIRKRIENLRKIGIKLNGYSI